MGKGGKLVPENRDEELKWDEVRQHTKRDDKWLVIEGEVYDITEWSRRHPGGSKVISHYAGQDATEAFRAFHNDLNHVRKYLKPIHIGHLPEEEIKQEAIKQDFDKLRETAHKMGLFKPSIVFFTLSIVQLLVLEVAAYLVLYMYGNGWFPWLASAILMATMQAQAGWIQHDYGHLSVFNCTWLNHALHQFTMCFMKGASCDWWNHLHYQHHAKPNVLNKDPDVRLDAVFVVGETMPKRVAKEKKKSMPYNWQQHYFFAIGPPLLFPLYFQYMVFRYTIERKKWLDLFTMMCFYIRVAVLYIPFFGVFGFLKWYFLVRVLESHWFVWVSQSNHIPMEIDDDRERPWLALQLHATCDIEKSFFNDWFTGHLNFQVEHHLFPTMPRHNLYKIVPLVKSLCEKHNMPYQTKKLSTAFADIIRSLKSSGEIWQHYYEAYHHT